MWRVCAAACVGVLGSASKLRGHHPVVQTTEPDDAPDGTDELNDDPSMGGAPVQPVDDFDDLDPIDDIDDEAGRQKRENVRVDVQLPLVVRMHGREIPARTRDVSATGVGFSTRLPVDLDQQAEVDIEFDGWTFTKRVVIRFVKPILAGCMVGAQFESLTEDERERLVKQVFDVQRSQLRAGRSADA